MAGKAKHKEPEHRIQQIMIGTYTNSVKDYCDKEFFENLEGLKQGCPVVVIDNSARIDYLYKLRKLAPYADIRKIGVPDSPRNSRFQRNVTESANYLRDIFLESTNNYLLIIESDVIPPADLLDRLKKRELPDNWGILGALYYKSFHDYTLTGLHQTHHCLSGCTLYKREVIEKFPFRYDPNHLGGFPDYWISLDAGKEYSLWNDHDIHCKHLHTKEGLRISRPL